MPKRKKQGTDAVLRFSDHKRKRVDELEADLDELFKLPLTEFTGARNALAARLKKSGRGDEAARVKALTKPSISAWAVNQLYWHHRKEFDQLIASGERFHKAQKSGKVADMRTALDARRKELTHLSDLATSLLSEAGHNPSLDTIRRTTTTLEGISAYAQLSDGPRPGRLTHDVDPPGFESFASFVPGMRSVSRRVGIAGGSTSAKRKEVNPPATLRTLFLPSHKGRGIAGGTDLTTTNTPRKVASDDDARQHEETRKAKIAAAKVSLQEAKRSLAKARARAESLEAAQKKADAEAKKAEKHRRDVEASLEKAKGASEAATRRARSVGVELEESATAVDADERIVEKASKELESLSRE
jgi:hypothetical protein